MSKRYEKMSKEEILDTFLVNCPDCVLRGIKCREDTCELTKVCYLKEEIKTKKVHRYELIKSPEDIDGFLLELESHCLRTCEKCPYGPNVDDNFYCFSNYMKEEIEVEE